MHTSYCVYELPVGRTKTVYTGTHYLCTHHIVYMACQWVEQRLIHRYPLLMHTSYCVYGLPVGRTKTVYTGTHYLRTHHIVYMDCQWVEQRVYTQVPITYAHIIVCIWPASG